MRAIIFLFWIVFIFNLFASEYMIYANNKDYVTALKYFQKLTDQGNAKGQNGLGKMYAEGLGVTKDFKEALKLFKLSAEQGYASAQNNLGEMYAYGAGVTQDFKEASFICGARKWYCAK